MSRISLLSLKLVATLLIVVGMAETLLFASKLVTRHRAEALLAEVQKLRLGKSTFASTQALRIQFRARKNPDAMVGSFAEQSYSMVINNETLNIVATKFPSLGRFGARPSGTMATLIFRDEELTYLQFYAGEIQSIKSSGPTEISAEVRLVRGSPYKQNGNYEIGLYERPRGGIEARTLFARITPEASDEQREAAFNFDLSCFSSFRGCRASCEMMPAIWRDELQRLSGQTTSLPKSELADSKCAKPHL